MTTYTSESLTTNRRQFRQADLNSLIEYANALLKRGAMAWRQPKRDKRTGVVVMEQVTARVSQSRISREARSLLTRYSPDVARDRMRDWIELISGDEFESYQLRSR